MYLMENSDFGKKLLCVNIELQQDGDLVCRIARFKLPRRVVFLDSLPKSALGKVQKPALQALLTGTNP
jgi:fatty-acyl-CoA synthase